MKSYFLVILTFFIVHLGFQADAQNLEILAEHDFIEILAGIHPKQDSFLLTDEKFNEKGELVLFQQIKIENKIIVAEDFFYCLTQTKQESKKPQLLFWNIFWLRILH